MDRRIRAKIRPVEMADYEAGLNRRSRGGRRRGLSGLGILLVAVGLLALAVTYSALGEWIGRLWPLALVAVGVFGLMRRPGWVDEMDLAYGPQPARVPDRPRRTFGLALVGLGLVCLLFTLRVVDTRLVGPGLLVGLGLLLIWRRAR